MKSVLFLIYFISLFSFSQGVIWDDKVKEQIKSSFKKVDFQITRSFYPPRYSLEKHTPGSAGSKYVYNQGELGMCVAYALANCRTIIYAKNKRLRGTKIFDNSFSPFFLYFNSKEKDDNRCKGISAYAAFKTLEGYGVPKIRHVEHPNYWPFTNKNLCNSYPPSLQDDFRIASEYKADIELILKEDYLNTTLISILKQELSSGNPIYFSMNPFPKSLHSFVYGEDFWNPNSAARCKGYAKSQGRQCNNNVKFGYQHFPYCHYHQKPSEGIGHAMVIIAYDDYKYGGSFQILNSHGAEWGSNGTIWIKYNDLIKYSSFFASISRGRESVFGSIPSTKENDLNNESTEEYATPSYIEYDKEPPLKDYIINKLD